MKKLLKILFRPRGRTLQRGFELTRLKARLEALPPDDPLWPQLLELLDAYLLTEAGMSVTPGLDDGEAHRFRGRVGMLLDLRADLQRVWVEAHSPAP